MANFGWPDRPAPSTPLLSETGQSRPIVFIDDAHTFGGTQVALAWTIRVVLTMTEIPVLCVCTPRTRGAVEAVTGTNPRLRFLDAPPALPLNLFTFPLRLPQYWLLLRRLRRQGVRAWWLNLADIEFGLAPLLVLRGMGERVQAYLQGTGRFTFFHQAAGPARRWLSAARDAIANRFVYRLHPLLVAPSRASQAEIESRIASRKRPEVDFLYYPEIGPRAAEISAPERATSTGELQLWMIGNVIQGHKNNLVVLDVLEQLQQLGHSATLTVAGVGPDLARFQQQALARGLADRISYLGWVTDPCDLVPKQAIIFIPSFHETMNLVAREAMRHGLRLVASPIPVFHEWIPAPLLAASFSPQAFTQRLLEVRSFNEDTLGELYRSALGRFSNELFLEKFLRLTKF